MPELPDVIFVLNVSIFDVHEPEVFLRELGQFLCTSGATANGICLAKEPGGNEALRRIPIHNNKPYIQEVTA